MKSMKKIFVIAIVTALAVVACGGGKKGATTPTNKADPSMDKSGSGAGSGSGSAMAPTPSSGGDPCGG
jgi:hypothetical protein